MPLHPEHAELRPFGNGGVQRRGEGDPQHVAGLRGIDDAIVPQPRGRVIRVALLLVFGADRRLEGFRLFGRPVGRVTVNGRQHARRLLAPITLIRALGHANRNRG